MQRGLSTPRSSNLRAALCSLPKPEAVQMTSDRGSQGPEFAIGRFSPFVTPYEQNRSMQNQNPLGDASNVGDFGTTRETDFGAETTPTGRLQGCSWIRQTSPTPIAPDSLMG